MPFGTTDQLKIYKGDVKPKDNLLKDLLAHHFLQDAFIKNEAGYKPTLENTDATNYVNKMSRAVNEVIAFSPETLERLLRYAVISLGEKFTFAIIQGLANDNDWIVKIDVVKPETWQKLAKVTDAELTAYNAI